MVFGVVCEFWYLLACFLVYCRCGLEKEERGNREGERTRFQSSEERRACGEVVLIYWIGFVRNEWIWFACISV